MKVSPNPPNQPVSPTSAISLLCLLTSALLLVGCVAPAPKPPPAPAKPRVTYWKGDGVSGTPRIIVALEEQRAYFFKGHQLVGDTPISSGRKGFETPKGSFKVTQKDEKHVSNLYGDFVDESGEVIKRNVDMSKDKVPEGATFVGSPMPFFLRFTQGFGLHSGKLPGYRASHGCVRLPRYMAEHFYQHAQVGTPVLVTDRYEG